MMSNVNSLALAILPVSAAVKITTTTPTTIVTKALVQTSMALATATTYTFHYTTMNKHEAGGSFVITAPATVAVAASMSTCTVTYNSVSNTMVCSVSGQVITVSTGFTTVLAKGAVVYIAVGPITNPITQNLATASFSIVSYTASSLLYQIDTVSTDLVPDFDCNYPCKTCNVG